MHDNAFDALAAEQRRALLLALLDANPRDATTLSPASEQTKAMAPDREMPLAMYHNHLPKLEDYGYIRWDEATNEVTTGPRFEELQPLLDWLADHAEQ